MKSLPVHPVGASLFMPLGTLWPPENCRPRPRLQMEIKIQGAYPGILLAFGEAQMERASRGLDSSGI